MLERQSLSDFVPDEHLRAFPSMDAAIAELERTPEHRDAATTLFWRLWDDVDELDPDAVTPLASRLCEIWRSQRLVVEASEGAEGLGDDDAVAQLVVASTLLTLHRLGLWQGAGLMPELVESGSNAFKRVPFEAHGVLFISSRLVRLFMQQLDWEPTSSLQDDSDSGSTDEPSTSDVKLQASVASITAQLWVSAFELEMGRADYLAALEAFAMSAACLAWSESAFSIFLKQADAATCYRLLTSEASRLESGGWRRISEACYLIGDALDADSPDLEGDSPEPPIKWPKAYTWNAKQFWAHAARESENRMSPSDLVAALDQAQTAEHVTRLQIDFLGTLFEAMTESSRNALVQAEKVWYTSDRDFGRRMAAVHEYRHVFEYELREMLFVHTWQIVKRLLQENPEGRRGKVPRTIEALSLGDMIWVIEKLKNLDTSTARLRTALQSIGVSQTIILTIASEVLPAMRDVNNIRNDDEHGTKTEKALLTELAKARKAILGIGQKGAVAALLDIKKGLTRRP